MGKVWNSLVSANTAWAQTKVGIELYVAYAWALVFVGVALWLVYKRQSSGGAASETASLAPGATPTPAPPPRKKLPLWIPAAMVVCAVLSVVLAHYRVRHVKSIVASGRRPYQY